MVILAPSSVLPQQPELLGRMKDEGEKEEERPPAVHLPYVAGISERIMRVCKDFNLRAVFKSGPTL